MSTITFDTIDKSIRNIDLDVMGAVPEPESRTTRLLTMDRGVRPLLTTVTLLPVLPPKFREALSLFLVTFDQFAQAVPEAEGGFKAGKDL